MITLGNNEVTKAFHGSTWVKKMYLGSELVYGNTIDGHQISQIRMPYGSILDTGYYPNNTTKVELGYIPISKNSYSVVCSGKTSDNEKQFSIQYSLDVTEIFVFCGTGYSSSTNVKSYNIIPYQYYDIEFSDNEGLKINGTSFSMMVGQTFRSDGKMYINGQGNGTGLSESIYSYFKVYDNGTLVRNYVPWKRANGDVGMFDLVNMEFVSSMTNVAFTDNTIELPSGYTRLNYISATGVQRFNCDFTPTYTTNYAIRCVFTGNAGFKSILSSRYSSSSRRYELMSGASSAPNTEIYFGYNNGSENYLNIPNYENKEFMAVKSENTIYYYFNGTYDTYKSRARSSFTCPKPLTIGCSNTNGNYANWFVGDIVELLFFGKAHYIPCLSPTNEVGMYDILNNTFKSSETDVSFVAGTVYE